MADHLLTTALQAAVPLEIHRIAALTPRHRRDLLNDAVTWVSGHGDELLYGGPHCTPTFTRLAAGLAVLAHLPGGVTFAGQHWCVDHTECLGGERTADTLDVAPVNPQTIPGLDRHRERDDTGRCAQCGRTWPCPPGRIRARPPVAQPDRGTPVKPADAAGSNPARGTGSRL